MTKQAAHHDTRHDDKAHRGAHRDARSADDAADPKLHPPGEDEASNAVKDPDTWTTGGESMTGAQASYLKTLCEEAHEEFDPGLTKGEASKKIDELRHKTGRGINH